MDPLAEIRKGTRQSGGNLKQRSYASILLRCEQQGGENPAGVIRRRQKQRGKDEKAVNAFFLAYPTCWFSKETLQGREMGASPRFHGIGWGGRVILDTSTTLVPFGDIFIHMVGIPRYPVSLRIHPPEIRRIIRRGSP